MVKTVRTAIEDETERFRQYVVASRSDPKVEPAAEACLGRLNSLYADHPAEFSGEDVRWLNVLRGYLGQRLAAHGGAKPQPRTPKRKGDQLDHCWRCQTPVDGRFADICPTCDSKAYHWRVCPVCRACGCQRDGKVLA